MTLSSTPMTLDGRRFFGVLLERGKTSGDADTLISEGGHVRSTACGLYDIGDGSYRWQPRDGALTFGAETESAKYGQLRRHGSVRGARLGDPLTMVRDGQAAGEKCVPAGEVER